MLNTPCIGIVTVTYNSAQVLPGFMASLLQQSYANWKLVVVDNVSSDGTLEQLEGYTDPRIEVVVNRENVGVAEGNNQGIDRAIELDCTYILLINNDVEFEPELLGKMVESIQKLQCDAVAPKILYFEPNNLLWFAGAGFRKPFFWLIEHFGLNQKDNGQYNRAVSIDYAPTCCVLFRKSVFAAVGRMDHRYFVYFDDVDFFLRMKRKNLTTYYLPQPHLYHKVSSLSGGGQSNFGIHMQARNTVYFVRKSFGPFLGGVALFGQQILFAARLLTKRDTFAVFKIKQKAFWEGMQMQLNSNRIDA